MAGAAQRQGAPGQEVEAEGGLDQHELHAVQAALLAPVRQPATAPGAGIQTGGNDRGEPPVPPEEFVHQGVAANDVPALPADSPTSVPLTALRIRRWNGEKRSERITGRYTARERAELEEAAASHGYEGSVSGFIADIALAFTAGLFTVTLPLSNERRALQEFRAQVLRALNRIGNNVNQIARAHNMGDHPTHTQAVLEDLRRLLEDIAEALCHPTEREG
ncbi:MobC family plasmid mobilization relaxosome protein [Allostreptomyces psammosilenae]|uniref:Bacterial mobilisation domain-containing protein n=1 Tax=Allostreptomyces psammosilenae TaxID=1892865 RepID=A0A852ZUH0_9ACTN|nr:MobC family plasmid mobilization relaxosome protein [Allostreptomyces psammosilenae]NYI05555.1 hypothetical protein [Allostreptomyces psammosilenae]